jgi:hypothetical protein
MEPEKARLTEEGHELICIFNYASKDKIKNTQLQKATMGHNLYLIY